MPVRSADSECVQIVMATHDRTLLIHRSLSNLQESVAGGTRSEFHFDARRRVAEQFVESHMFYASGQLSLVAIGC